MVGSGKEFRRPAKKVTGKGKGGEGMGREVKRTTVDPSDKSATFTFQLEEGPILLHTWLERSYRDPISGAFFVYVTRK